MNPLFNMMNGSKNSPISMIQSVLKSGNPQQAMMDMLKNKNPQAYQQLQQMMSSGQNPQDILNAMLSNMNPQQRQQIENIAKQFGFK